MSRTMSRTLSRTVSLRTLCVPLVLLVVGSAALTACTDQDAAAEEAADTFAAGLSAGDVSASVGAAGQEEWAAIREPLGETEPKASNSTEAGRSENRRVELAIFANETLKAEAQRSSGR